MKNLERKLHKLDAAGIAPGRLASKIAIILRGKNKASYEPHLDEGDVVEVLNAEEMKYTGNKLDQKKYYHYSGYLGGLKTKKISDLTPAKVLYKAVFNMLPPSRLRNGMMKRLIIK
ncbi:MAG: 50S ribosomal protein L13 [Candidatus Falkowbacteria bacterium]